ncbi:MAG: DNA repair protein RecN [Bacteroidota bacterium]|nr:DNA repair protein RecN [Bacteroidota bacterium]
MLKYLSIQNYAIIDKVVIDFHPGFSIITGETGAGKSIIMGALSLIIGQRADTSVLNDKSRKCIAEAEFDITRYNLKDFFIQNNIDYSDNTLIRREINEEGKSRAFINDTPVNLSVMRELGVKLIDIHSQHQNLNLSDNLFQLKVIDALAQHNELFEKYRSCYKNYRLLEKDYKDILENASKAKSDLDYFQFQFDQLNEAKLLSGEQEGLEVELEELKHAEEIKRNLSLADQLLSDDGNSVLNQLKESVSLTGRLIPFFPRVSEINQRLESAYIELKDIAAETDMLNEKMEINPERTAFINERLDLIYGLEQKHRVGSVDELIILRDELGNKIEGITSFDTQIGLLSKKLAEEKDKICKLAAKLSDDRMKVIPSLEKEVIAVLQQLGIRNANFKVVHSLLEDFTPNGLDRVSFLFSANRQSDLQDISKVASGGELSRVMLSIKYIISSNIDLPTIIFDEIDAGVSGEVADKMGNILKKMSKNMQVINITHLPQIACKGNYHYVVYKKDNNHTTYTQVRLLQPEERIMEIAKMLSGEKMTAAAIDNAKTLLSSSI